MARIAESTYYYSSRPRSTGLPFYSRVLLIWQRALDSFVVEQLSSVLKAMQQKGRSMNKRSRSFSRTRIAIEGC
ncbi:unnamed protein product [Calypogeia fissa]